MTPKQREAAEMLLNTYPMRDEVHEWSGCVRALLRELTAEPQETDSTGAMASAWFGTPGTEKAVEAVFGQAKTHTVTWDAQGRRLVNGELAPEHRTAEPQGEPVAMLPLTCRNSDRSDCALFGAYPPQQRKPLTDDQADALWRAAYREDRYRHGSFDWYAQGLRDGERAHGIGEAKPAPQPSMSERTRQAGYTRRSSAKSLPSDE